MADRYVAQRGAGGAARANGAEGDGQVRKVMQQHLLKVRSFSNVSEAASDSDDEDKLHIVEEDSISDVPDEKPTVFQLGAAQQIHNGHTEDDGNLGPDALIRAVRVKEECITDEEDDEIQKNETQIQRNEGAIFQEDEQSTPERGGHDENGTPDEFSQLHTCPYCSRGYKRHTSLKDHIKLRHEKSKQDFSCSLCNYNCSYRTQLDRHMTSHKNGREQRAVTQSGGNRKFKCTECSKAFKYKHHLKEHLRIHSGEKPYECSNCKKRFSHSGSYSSHISSKKCVGSPPALNALSRSPGVKAALTLSRPTRILLREKVDISNKPLHEQLPPKQIKQEPINHELKPVTTSQVVTTTTATTNNGSAIPLQTAAPQGVVQTLVVPTVGLTQPISINLSDLQNALKAAMDGNMIRQVVASTNANGTAAKVVGQLQPQTQAVVVQTPHQQAQVISAISLPVVDQDGNAKIIINYNIDPQVATSKMNTVQPVIAPPTVAQAKLLQPNVTPPKVVHFNSTQTPKVLQVNSAQPPKVLQVNSTQLPKVVPINSTQPPKEAQANAAQPPKVVHVNSLQPPKVVQVNSTQLSKLVQVNSTQPNVTLTQMPGTTKPLPTQINILKPIQTGNSCKVPSIYKVTKLVQSLPTQTKFSQPTVLLLRRTDGSQGLVVRQLTTVHSNTQVIPAIDSKIIENMSSPEKAMVTEKQISPVQQKQAGEDSIAPNENCQPEDLSRSLLQEIQIKTEPMSPVEIEPDMQTDGEDTLQTEGERAERTIAKSIGSDFTTAHSGVACSDGFHNYATCLFCDSSPSSADILNCLNSNEQGSGISLSSLLGEGDSGPPVESLLPLLKAYSKDSHPSEEQLSRVAESVSLPLDVVSRWFQRMRSKKISLRPLGYPKTTEQTLENSSQDPSIDSPSQILNTPCEPHEDSSLNQKSVPSPLNLSANDLIIVKTEESEEEGQTEPLDLSLPKSSCNNANASNSTSASTNKPSLPAQEEPLNLTCLKKDALPGNTIYMTQPTTSPVNIVAASLPTLVAIAEPGGVPCIRAAFSTNKRTILIPQLSYTYATPSTNSKAITTTSANTSNTTATPPSADTQGTVILSGSQEAAKAGGECASAWDGQNDGDLSPNRKRRKLQCGQFACDLCDKIFQKSSSLLRHKYEHTGKRPHECGVCKKAFKHKHHLIEHTRLHSGEKPYQCDKCGKRFSHSGSYSQHMNHRYSYCKKEAPDQPGPTHTPSHLDSDERESEAEEEEEEDEEREGERDANEEMEFADFDMSEIRVVRVGEEFDEEEEEEEDGEEEQVTEEEDAMELQVEEIDALEEVVEIVDMGESVKKQNAEEMRKTVVTDCVERTEEGKNN